MERLQKFLARCGVASRRHAETMMAAGRVAVNGNTVFEMGAQIDPDTDRVTVDGVQVLPPDRLICVALHKPSGYITSVGDPHGRRTVMDLVAGLPYRLFPVGRLDHDTEGLLLMTNDGDLAYALTHPRHEVNKEYHATVSGIPGPAALGILRRGVMLDGRATAPAKVEIMAAGNGYATLRIEIHEGRNRQVRRMCEAVGHPVEKLRRVRVGTITLGKTAPGEYRILSDAEVSQLRGGRTRPGDA